MLEKSLLFSETVVLIFIFLFIIDFVTYCYDTNRLQYSLPYSFGGGRHRRKMIRDLNDLMIEAEQQHRITTILNQCNTLASADYNKPLQQNGVSICW